MEIDAVVQALLVKRMHQRVACPVGSGTGSLSRMFAVLLHLSAEGALVDRSIAAPAV
jgi:hypothetical protein